jgi:hypothetical protein
MPKIGHRVVTATPAAGPLSAGLRHDSTAPLHRPPMPNDSVQTGAEAVAPRPPGDRDGGATLQLLALAELQDRLLEAGHDLDRLQRLIDDAGDSLMACFHGAGSEIQGLLQAPGLSAAQADLARGAMTHLARAITALQFQDMGTQLVAHTSRRLRGCADRLAAMAFADDEPGVLDELPPRPNPVTQDEMDAGSVELF